MRTKPLFFRLVVAAGLLLGALFVYSVVMLVRFGSVERNFGFAGNTVKGEIVVTNVISGGPAEGLLRPGDLLLGINEHRRLTPLAFSQVLYHLDPGPSYLLHVRRGSSELDLQVPVRTRRSIQVVDWRFPMYYPGALACLIVGLLLGLNRPRDCAAQMACVALLLLSGMSLGRVLYPVYHYLGGLGRAAYGLVLLADPLPVALGYQFASRFPFPVPERRPWRLWGVLIWIVGISEMLLRLPFWICFLNLPSGVR